MEILAENSNSIVVIKNAQRKDCGKYHISACNPSGTKGASTRVEVVGEYSSQKLTIANEKMKMNSVT